MNTNLDDTNNTKRDLVGLDRSELMALLAALDVPADKRKMRANQLWLWMYKRGETDFDGMTDLGKELREKLTAHCRVGRPEIVSHLTSIDRSQKWLLRYDDKNEAETVFIPEEDRGALCISSQVGCTLTCKFCHTGTQRMVRNLTAGEIVQQFMMARDSINEWPKANDQRMLSNIVMMGMGEPLYNYENVAKALTVIMDEAGLAMSRRRITLSTSGVVPEIDRCGAELNVGLAISLHAVNDELRDYLVPINKKYPLKELLAACRRYPTNGGRRITFEYVMLKGINDSPADARKLVQLIKGIPAKLNLIPFNPWPGVEFECSDDKAINKFAAIVNDAGYSSPVRVPRGRDIMAACGQLKSASERVRRKKAASA